MTTRTKTDAPPLDQFDLSNLREPDDGILYLYRSSVDGFWHIDTDEDMAMQEATGYPVGELAEHEEMGDYDDAEYGELHALYVGDSHEDGITQERPHQITSSGQLLYCPLCGEKTEREEIPIGEYRTNLEVRCPNHGQLWI